METLGKVVGVDIYRQSSVKKPPSKNTSSNVGLGACRGCIPKPKILIKQIWSEA